MATPPSRGRGAASTRPRLTPPTWRAATTLVVGGAFAIHAYELVARTVAPLLGRLIPALEAPAPAAPLAEAALAGLWDGAGAGLADLGFALHLLVGLVLQPLGYVALARPAMAAVWPAAPWWVTAALWGVALWALAMAALAGTLAGEPPFDGLGGLRVTAFWGHVAAALTIGAVWRARMGR
jgi:hypothetical protein